ncbi:DUF134 domain-containing protein [Salinispira pacifica]|nr:DUF134 domain-containing protein [Salinispira pacifica]
MGRQEKIRSMPAPPRSFRFTAEESPGAEKHAVILRLDEYEAIRLADQNGYNHNEAAEVMGISRPTFNRLLNKARGKMAEFLTSGSSLEISGGKVLFGPNVYCCKSCHRPFVVPENGEYCCPRCLGDNIIAARPECHHDCRCCEEEDRRAGQMFHKA